MTAGASGRSVVMLLENCTYPKDVRVRNEAESLVAAGHRVTVVAPRGSGQSRRETVSGVRVWRFELPPLPDAWAGFILEFALATLQLHMLGLLALLRGAGAVHLHNPPDTLFPIARVARALGRKVVYDQHDLSPELFRVKFGDGSPVVRVVEWMERQTFKAADVAVVPNESHKDLAVQRGGVPADRVFVVRNAPPSSALVPAVDGRPGPLREPRLLFLGAMEAQDGVDALPDLLRELADRHGMAPHLTLVGEGSRRPVLERALREAGFGERVVFTGHVPVTEVPSLLAQADICVDPAVGNDLNHRSTMMKIAEYMAAGKPVVAHRLVETERTAEGAAVFPDREDVSGLAEAVARVASDPELRAGLARAGLTRVRDLTWDRSEVALLQAYAAL